MEAPPSTASPEAEQPRRASSPRATRRTLPRPARNAILTVHIITSVALLGDCAALLAVAIRAATTDDPAVAAALNEQLEIFGSVFGLPLSVAALVTGIALGMGTRWGVLRHPWVVIKLALILSVMVAGGAITGPAATELVDGTGEPYPQLIAGGLWDVVALSTATGLSVFKPGRARRRARPTAPAA